MPSVSPRYGALLAPLIETGIVNVAPWQAFAAPKGLPADIKAKLSAANQQVKAGG